MREQDVNQFAHMSIVKLIISGGQTGADRAALDAALAHGIAYGGWCPKGGRAEDMPEPPGLLAPYPALRETPDNASQQRTEWNVRDSDATLVLAGPADLIASPGAAFTIACAERLAKPLLIADARAPDAVAEIESWLSSHCSHLKVNIAGPRESETPGIYAAARSVLNAVLARSVHR